MLKNGSNNHWNNASKGEGKNLRDGQEMASGMSGSLRKPVINSEDNAKGFALVFKKPEINGYNVPRIALSVSRF